MPPGAKPAVQSRSKRSRDAILDALDALLREKPFDAVGVTEIAACAGVSPATIYQRFSNKDAAVAVLLELYLRAVADWSRAHAAEVQEVFTAPSLRTALEALGRMACRQFDDLGHVLRPAYLYSRLKPEILGARWNERMARAHADFEALLTRHRTEIARSDLSRAGGMIAGFYNMMCVGRLLHADDGPKATGAHDPETFARELADFACGYLATPDGARS